MVVHWLFRWIPQNVKFCSPTPLWTLQKIARKWYANSIADPVCIFRLGFVNMCVFLLRTNNRTILYGKLSPELIWLEWCGYLTDWNNVWEIQLWRRIYPNSSCANFVCTRWNRCSEQIKLLGLQEIEFVLNTSRSRWVLRSHAQYLFEWSTQTSNYIFEWSFDRF